MWGGVVTGVLTGASSLAAAACFLIFCLVSACCFAACTGSFSACFACSSCVAVSAPRFFAATLASLVLFRKFVGTVYAPNLLLA